MTEPHDDIEPDACQDGQRDGCAVETEPLARVVSRFVESWNKTRPPTGGHYSGRNRARLPQRDTMSALDWLSQETGLKVTHLKSITVKRTRARSSRPAMTELRHADAIVNAIGVEHVFQDGTLPILPNPRASKALRAACCSGSGS